MRMPRTRAAALQAALCESPADAGDACDACRRPLLKGEHLFWFSDGNYWDSREGSYVCSECAVADVNDDTRFSEAPLSLDCALNLGSATEHAPEKDA